MSTSVLSLGILLITIAVLAFAILALSRFNLESEGTVEPEPVKRSSVLTTITRAKEEKTFPIIGAINNFMDLLGYLKTLKVPSRFQAETSGNSIYIWHDSDWKFILTFNTDSEPIRISIENIHGEAPNKASTQTIIT